jgi:hypothetical protein
MSMNLVGSRFTPPTTQVKVNNEWPKANNSQRSGNEVSFNVFTDKTLNDFLDSLSLEDLTEFASKYAIECDSLEEVKKVIQAFENRHGDTLGKVIDKQGPVDPLTPFDRKA